MALSLLFLSALGIASSLQSFAQLQSRQAVATVDRWDFLGCYTDKASSRTLNAASSTNSSMTVASCLAFCIDYQYAGVEYARECYCDNTINGPGTVTDIGECNTPCAGDATSFCGAGNRIDIYNQTVQIPVPAIKPSVGSWQYKGCFREGADRDLRFRIDIAEGVSAETCTATCRANSYGLAGLEYGRECWCDNYMPYGQQVDDTKCSMPCAGNNMELCGGSLSLALYQDGDATPLDPQTCFPQDFITNIELQAIAKQGPQNPVQISSQTIVLPTDGVAQVVSFSVCPHPCSPFHSQIDWGFGGGTFGLPFIGEHSEALPPVVGESLRFVSFSSGAGYTGYCAKPNPVSPSGPFIGFPILSANGHTDLWALCTNTTAGGRVDVVYSPIANHPNYDLAECQDVYIQMTQRYALVP